MPPTRPPYPSELKRQIVELVCAGRVLLNWPENLIKNVNEKKHNNRDIHSCSRRGDSG